MFHAIHHFCPIQDRCSFVAGGLPHGPRAFASTSIGALIDKLSMTTTTTSAMTFVWDAPSQLNDCVFSAWWFTLSEVLEDGSLGSAFVPSGCEALTSICESICTATSLRPFTRYSAHVGVECEDPRANSVESNSSTVPVTVSFSARGPRDLPGDPPSSAYIVAGVRTKPARVSAPTNVTIAKADGNSVLVEWTPGDGSLINCQFHSWLVVTFYGSRKVVSPPGCTVSELPIFDRTRRGCTAELDQCDVTVEFVVQELCVLPDADSASSRRSFPVRIEHGDDCFERAAPPTSLASASPTVNTLRLTWLGSHFGCYPGGPSATVSSRSWQVLGRRIYSPSYDAIACIDEEVQITSSQAGMNARNFD